MASALVVWNFCRTNRLFAASHLRGKKPPCWRAKVALGQDKQKTYLILNSNFLCCLVPGRLFLSSTAVLFCARWMASYKGPISGFWSNNFCGLQDACHLFIPFSWQANKLWSSEDECPQQFVFYGQKAEATAGVCSTHRQQKQGEVLPNSHGLTNFKKLITIFFWRGGGGGK